MRPILFAWLAGAIALIVVAFFLEPFVVVPAGSRGVLLDFGAVQPEPLAPGLHLITPIVQSVVEMDTRVQLHQDTEEAASHDLQDVHGSRRRIGASRRKRRRISTRQSVPCGKFSTG